MKDARELGKIGGKSHDVATIDCDFERTTCMLFQID